MTARRVLVALVLILLAFGEIRCSDHLIYKAPTILLTEWLREQRIGRREREENEPGNATETPALERAGPREEPPRTHRRSRSNPGSVE